MVNQRMNAIFIAWIPQRLMLKGGSDFGEASFVRKLGDVLEEIVNSSQGGFAKGTQILDAVLIANELVDEQRKRGTRGWRPCGVGLSRLHLGKERFLEERGEDG